MARPDYRLFDELAPRIMRDLLRDVPQWRVQDAAAAVGNAGHESGGFRTLQETSPTVPGSRGGWGWFQWTGPRRRAMEAWAKGRRLDLASYEANYGWLLQELRGSENAAVAATKRAAGLQDKVKAFEAAFERAGVKHYPSRIAYAQRALRLYREAQIDTAAAAPVEMIARPADPGRITDPHQVSLVQGWLRNLGYTEVGTPDGKIGPYTRGAIAAYRDAKGLPAGDWIDDALILTLAKDREPRQVAPERAQADPAMVQRVAPEARPTWCAKVWSGVTALGAGAVALAQGVVGKLQSARDYLQPVQDLLGDVPPWVWAAGAAAIAAYIWHASRRAEAEITAAVQTGARR